MYGFIIMVIILAIGVAAYNFYAVKRRDPGTKLMMEIAHMIQDGADTFMAHETRVIIMVASVIAVLLSMLVSWHTGVAFIIGALMSGSAGYIGMRIATYTNVRVSNEARKSGSLGETLKVAFQEGHRRTFSRYFNKDYGYSILNRCIYIWKI